MSKPDDCAVRLGGRDDQGRRIKENPVEDRLFENRRPKWGVKLEALGLVVGDPQSHQSGEIGILKPANLRHVTRSVEKEGARKNASRIMP